MKTSSIVPTLQKIVSKPVQFVANNKYMKKFCDKFEEAPDKMIAYTTIASIVGKDTIGCYLYVKQSLNNEKIPEEKRSFVAALDLTNGLLMIMSQLAAFFIIDNKIVQSKMFDKFFGKLFENKAIDRTVSQIRNVIKRGSDGMAKPSKAVVKAEIKKFKKISQDMFKFVTSLVASTIVAKRIIVPFLATPLAGWAQEKFIDKRIKKTTKTSQDEKPSNDMKNRQIVANKNVLKAKNEPEFKGNLLEKYKDK